MKPRLIDKWKDKYDNITNKLYQYPNGVRLLVATNPRTIEFDFSVVVSAGSYYEKQLGVPQGTAHFLEHMLCSPNNLCKTDRAIEEYTQGSKSRASFSKNASTSHKFLYFYAHGHENAAGRMLKFTSARILYPLKKFPEYIERERKVIISEIQRMPKEDRDSNLQWDKQFWGEFAPEFALRRVGTVDSVNEITVDNLMDYYHKCFVGSNVAIAVQTSGNLSKEHWGQINDLAHSILSNKPQLRREIKRFTPKFKANFFEDPDRSAIFVGINYFYHLQKKLDYRRDRLFVLLRSLISNVGYDYLRQEKHLVYSVSAFNNIELFNCKDRGLAIEVDKGKLLEVLDETYHLLYTKLGEFLDSASGKKWLNDQVSSYIFRGNDSIDNDYAESLAVDVLDDIMEYKFDYAKSKKEMLKMATRDVKEFINEFLKIEPIFWFNGPHNREEIEEIFKQSKFYKRFAK